MKPNVRNVIKINEIKQNEWLEPFLGVNIFFRLSNFKTYVQQYQSIKLVSEENIINLEWKE